MSVKTKVTVPVGRRWRSTGAICRIRVLLQDLPLERLQLRAGLEAELVVEPAREPW